MSRRSRIVAWGSAAGLIVAGIACVTVSPGSTGQVLAIVLIGGALVLATSLVFFEVGLSEDRDRALEQPGESQTSSDHEPQQTDGEPQHTGHDPRHIDHEPRRRLQRPQRRRRP